MCLHHKTFGGKSHCWVLSSCQGWTTRSTKEGFCFDQGKKLQDYMLWYFLILIELFYSVCNFLFFAFIFLSCCRNSVWLFVRYLLCYACLYLTLLLVYKHLPDRIWAYQLHIPDIIYPQPWTHWAENILDSRLDFCRVAVLLLGRPAL